MRHPQLNEHGELKHLLTIEGLPRSVVTHILDTAEGFVGVADREVKKVPLLRGKSVFNLFFENSTRTRTTFEIAAKRLSADVLNLDIARSSASKGESLLATIANLSAKQLAAFRNQHIGFVFQFHHLLPEFTALENVCIPGFIRQEPRQSVEKRAKELLDYLGLTNRLSHKPTELSGGEQQRVAVARALINQPNIIFADEPTGNLDSSASKDFHLLIRQLCDDKKQTFVIVTHNQELADLLAYLLELRKKG